MIGATRSRVSFFMNRFRKLGFIQYNRRRIQVHKIAAFQRRSPRLSLCGEAVPRALGVCR